VSGENELKVLNWGRNDMMDQTSSQTTAHKLERLAEIYRQGQASEVMDKTLDKLFDYEAETCRSQILELENDLSGFEKRYGKSSEDFYRSFQAGKEGDHMDFVEWASIIQMVQRLKERLSLLTIQKSA
jgi:hypothetical protein